MDAELTSYLDMIEDLRCQVGELVSGLPADALNWRPLEGEGDKATNSLAVLATHIAGAEHLEHGLLYLWRDDRPVKHISGIDLYGLGAAE